MLSTKELDIRREETKWLSHCDERINPTCERGTYNPTEPLAHASGWDWGIATRQIHQISSMLRWKVKVRACAVDLPIGIYSPKRLRTIREWLLGMVGREFDMYSTG
jgi:hypothetical protein